MLTMMRDVPPGIEAVRAGGVVTRAEYQEVVEPLLEAARQEDRRIRMLFQVGPDFQRFSAAAAWEDTKVGLSALRLFEGCAVVTDIGWIRELSRLGAFLVSCPVRVFEDQERDEAVTWLGALPEGAGVEHRLEVESGVLVVEVQQPLRVQDFDALALTADSWLAGHDELSGIVVHARAFPGWQNFPSLLRHIRFVRDHHRKVERVALAADTALAGLVPHLATHFVHAEVVHFHYDDLDEAITWASGAAARR